jgi:uncharacterized membrane protein YcaP (DUF421 family)
LTWMSIDDMIIYGDLFQIENTMEIFEWKRVLLNDLPGHFLLEVVFRSAVMFIFLLVALKFTGKRGVKQLSIFETVLIIALGSAAGDPMFYEDVGILPALLVFAIVIGLYRVVTWLTGKNRWFEILVEGKTVTLIHEGKFSVAKFEKEPMAQDEFFSELRLQSVEHLGQVRYAFLEPSGDVSVFFYDDQEVKYGLPVLPELFEKKSAKIPSAGIYACAFCGNTEDLSKPAATCSVCKRHEWVHAIRSIRTR